MVSRTHIVAEREKYQKERNVLEELGKVPGLVMGRPWRAGPSRLQYQKERNVLEELGKVPGLDMGRLWWAGPSVLS